MAPVRTWKISAGDGRRLHVAEYGPTRDVRLPLLCLPGLVRNVRDFELIAIRAGEQRRVITLDYRGRGLSERDPDWRKYRPDVDIYDIRHVRCARHIDRVVVLGTSYGGILAMALGAVAPSMLAGVILNDIGPAFMRGAYDAIVTAIGTDRVIDTLANAPGALRKMFPAIRFQTPELLDAAARNTFRKGPDGRFHVDWDTAIARALTTSPPPPSLWSLFATLRHVPTLAIRGACSNLLTEDGFDRMAAAKPDLVRVAVPGTAHAPTLEEPEARAAIEAFLAEF